MNRTPNRDEDFYRCRVCGFECRKKRSDGSGSNVPVTLTGDYGNAGGPDPETYDDEMYEAATISFVAASGDDPAYMADSTNLIGAQRFTSGMTIKVETTSGTNDGTYTIGERGISNGKIELSSSDSLTTESSATAGTVTISRVLYKPFTSASGCPFCGSRNSR